MTEQHGPGEIPAVSVQAGLAAATGAVTPDGEPTVSVELTQRQARYLSVLAAADLRASHPGSSVARDIHEPAWQALQPACDWEG